MKLSEAIQKAFAEGKGNDIGSRADLIPLIKNMRAPKLAGALLQEMRSYMEMLQKEMKVEIPDEESMVKMCKDMAAELGNLRTKLGTQKRMQKLREKDRQ